MKASYYIGHTTNNKDRFRASSGGIGTAITRYLLSQPEYGTSITFVYDRQQCMYVPKLIYSADEINVCGSIYHDIDIVRFIQKNISDIQGGIVICCPPCQVTAIRQILNKNNIQNFILSYCCSGQTTIEGTWKYYEFLGINKDDVINMQYRGNGWPSGIQIWLKDGKKIHHDNYTEPWATIHRSQLYRPTRCFYCKRDTGREADIAIADPWLKEYIDHDKVGNTMFVILTDLGNAVFERMSNKKIIQYIPTDYNKYAIAQRPNIQKEIIIYGQQKHLRRLIKLIGNRHYKKWATKSTKNMIKHMTVCRILRFISTPKKNFEKTMNILTKIRNKGRNYYYRNKLGSKNKDFMISGGVTIKNPECIYLGKGVGIGSNTFLGPVIKYAGIPYNPKIIIGEGTWVGKNCSIAAIERVEIGKHVLFAGYVHITDHSHGYENITSPIAPQPLISKGPVIIEDDCWLGFSCEILSGVHIGKHCVVAARAVVTKDVPPYSIVAGNPARVVKKYKFDSRTWVKTYV